MTSFLILLSDFEILVFFRVLASLFLGETVSGASSSNFAVFAMISETL